MTSGKYNFNKEDFKRWGSNTLLFLAPLALIYLSFVLDNLKASGFSLNIFVPDTLIYGAISLYVLNAGTDLIRKFVKDNTK